MRIRTNEKEASAPSHSSSSSRPNNFFFFCQDGGDKDKRGVAPKGLGPWFPWLSKTNWPRMTRIRTDLNAKDKEHHQDAKTPRAAVHASLLGIADGGTRDKKKLGVLVVKALFYLD
ncbi:MAG: hypothetical protein HY014_05810 [Acidobacteria bacterium]|nr:hypothetical protein [Acidobacteriota bacterium]MBI3487664.1 hypothetical protein [Acidobacteriota bacterium]